MQIDFHCHSTASDGTLPPDRLAALAAENGVEYLSITDHDTVDAYSALGSTELLTIVPGVELSTVWRTLGIHIVGLNIDPRCGAMAEAVTQQRHARELRARGIAEKLERYGLKNPLEGALKHAGAGIIGRPHFARHMVEAGFVTSEQEAFKKYLGSGKPCDIKHTWAPPEKIVEWIRGAGGVAVLAHPAKYQVTRTRLTAMIEDFKCWGGEAMEVVSGLQLPGLTRDLASLCETFGLHGSWGSDFHRPGQHWAALGKYSTPPPQVRPVWELWG